jgi:hypothetical protein
MITRKQRQASARAKAKARIAPNISQAPTAIVRRWFDDALDSDDPKPSRAACEQLAREFQTIINRQNNAQLESNGPVPLGLLKDVWLPEEINKRVRKITDAAKQLIVAACELEDFAGGYHWGEVSLNDVKDFLQRIILSPEASAALATQTVSLPASTRRPRERWHAAGREMARFIKAAMRDVNYRGRLDDDEESVIAIVGAAAINWAYAISPKIGSATFAGAMKDRDRSKAAKAKKLKSLTDEQSSGATHIKNAHAEDQKLLTAFPKIAGRFRRVLPRQ